MMPKTIRLAIIQFARDRFHPDKNIRRMKNFLRCVEGADLVCLPEAWVVLKMIDRHEEKKLIQEFAEIAAAGKFALVTGGLFIFQGTGFRIQGSGFKIKDSKEKIYDTNPKHKISDFRHQASEFNSKFKIQNSKLSISAPRTAHHAPEIKDVCHVIGSDGKLIGTVEKIFPSFPLGERNYCMPGSRLPIFEVAGAKVGIAICVDLFYPELCRSLAMRGAEVILNPSNIPESRLPLWHALVQARAAENTVFTVFVSNTHTEYPDNRPVRGGSIVAAPWGDVLYRAGKAEKILYVNLDLNQVYETRKRWRYLDDIKEIKIRKSGRIIRK